MKDIVKDCLLILLILLIYFLPVIFSPVKMISPSQDIAGIYYPDKQFLVSEIYKHKNVPLWNPYILSGEPFVAKPSTAVFYPLNLLYLLLPLNVAFGIVFILDFYLLGIFTYLFSRKIGIKRFGSLIASITCMFSAPLICLIFLGHIINLDTFIWFPLILLGFEYLIQTGNFRYTVLTSIPLALSFLAGAPQIAAYMLLGASIYLLLRSIGTKWRGVIKIFFLYLIILVFTFGLAAIQILPTIELSKLSIRANGLPFDFATDFLLPPYQLVSFLFPHFFGGATDGTFWGKGNFASSTVYIGIVPFFLAVFSIITSVKSNKYIKIFLFLTIFSLLYAMGKYTPIFYIFYKYIPDFNGFRVPGRFLYIYAFSMAILVGFGFDRFLKFIEEKKYQKLFKIIVNLGLVFIIFFSLAFLLLVNNKDIVQLYEQIVLRNSFAVGINHTKLVAYFFADVNKLLIILLIVFILILLIKVKKLKKSFILIFMLLIIFLDLWTFGQPLINTNPKRILYHNSSIIEKIKSDQGKFRVFDMTGSLLSNLEVNNIESISGVHSLQLKDYRNFLWQIGDYEPNFYESFVTIKSIDKPKFLDLLSVKYIISSQEFFLPAFTELMTENFVGKRIYLYKNNNFLPEIYIVDKQNYKEKIDFEKSNANSINLKVNLKTSGSLFISYSLYPGWKAYDNGKNVPLTKISTVQEKINLSSGSHNINFIFDPISYKIGLIISLFSVFSLLVFLIWDQITSNLGSGKIK